MGRIYTSLTRFFSVYLREKPRSDNAHKTAIGDSPKRRFLGILQLCHIPRYYFDQSSWGHIPTMGLGVVIAFPKSLISLSFLSDDFHRTTNCGNVHSLWYTFSCLQLEPDSNSQVKPCSLLPQLSLPWCKIYRRRLQSF